MVLSCIVMDQYAICDTLAGRVVLLLTRAFAHTYTNASSSPCTVRVSGSVAGR